MFYNFSQVKKFMRYCFSLLISPIFDARYRHFYYLPLLCLVCKFTQFLTIIVLLLKTCKSNLFVCDGSYLVASTTLVGLDYWGESVVLVNCEVALMSEVHEVLRFKIIIFCCGTLLMDIAILFYGSHNLTKIKRSRISLCSSVTFIPGSLS